MADVKWIKLTTNIFENRKIRQIECLPDGDAIIVIWVKLLCLAGNINDSGFVYFTKEIPYTEQMLATQFNRPLTTIQLALRTFEQFGMLEVIDNVFHISNWEKYQSVDRLSEIREYNRLAKQKSREKQKLLQDVNDMSMTSQRCQGTDIDIEEELDKNKNKRYARKPFTPPTLEEVQAYCLERKNNVDAQKFYDYFSASDWYDSKGSKVKSWKQKVITWENNGLNNKTQNQQQSTQQETTGNIFIDMMIERGEFMEKADDLYECE